MQIGFDGHSLNPLNRENSINLIKLKIPTNSYIKTELFVDFKT